METLEQALAATPREIDYDAGDGTSTCLWHRKHEHYIARVVPILPRCDICGGEVDPRQSRHEICRVRQMRGLPTPRESTVRNCGCSKCRKS